MVQSIAHKVTRPCSRNGCPAPARASMALDYAGKQVTLVPLLDEHDPRFLEVCPAHAERTDVPRGWELVDERGDEAPAPVGPPSADEIASGSTVAVLAAALREGSVDHRRPDETPTATAGARVEAAVAAADAPPRDDRAPEVMAEEAVAVEDPVADSPSPVDERDASSTRPTASVHHLPGRTFDLPVNDFDADVVPRGRADEAPAPAAGDTTDVVPRQPSGRMASPTGRSPREADERQLPLTPPDEPVASPRRSPRPVPAARTGDRRAARPE